ncbi:SusC/RagA family TonB-linked outer membrane protein [Mucilaginibacter flavus]|uniref:SusC/RagA family TonB-linked outer membrane protein n=1 Tax=Mucilaginibacter flavus TaxID=931504 RepID=UPI0025B2CB05|nr:TonB-dependent receptor [Mucilaginibacter flavus]MDN3581397.1 TonB-dependent receptor [Mucilaginibacter flavus]
MKHSTLITITIVILGTLSYAEPIKAQSIADQIITLKLHHVTLQNALSQIEDKSQCKFVYGDNILPLSKYVSLNIKKEPLSNALSALFRPYPVNIEYSGIYVLIKTKKATSAKSSGTVTGTVTDAATGETLVGVNISIKGTDQATSTDVQGRYNINVISDNAILVFSYIGYTTKEILVGTQSHIDVKLSTGVSALNQVVVVGYGSQKKQDVTSSIISVKPDKLDKGATNDPIKFLQGRAAGVNVLTPSGIPGTKPIVLVRGTGSISGASSPLYVIDGVPFETTPNLNPDDIESMDVLKDAAASAIYGSRANSGVVIITTKSGKEGKTQLNVSAHTGTGRIYNDIPMANAAQYTAVMQDAVKNYNAQKGTSLTLYVPPVIQETNWVKLISRESAVNNAAAIDISGGNKNTNIFTSFGYFGQQGILKNSNYNQYNYRLNLNHTISRYFTLHTNLSGSYTSQRLLEEGNSGLKVLYTAREEQPWYGPYNADGSDAVNGVNGIIRHNPVMLINEEIWKTNTTEGIGRISLDFTPIKGLTFTPSVSAYGSLFNNNKKLTDKMVARNVTAGNGAILQDRNIAYRFVLDNVLSYKNNAGKLDYNVLAGHSFEKYTNDQLGVYSSNYANAAYPSTNLNAVNAGTNIYPDVIGYDSYALESYFGRLTLDYDNRYILNTSLRSDGSSRFSSNKRYGTFPSVSLGWQVMNESFMKETSVANTLSQLKLRTSYGVTGSLAGIGNYANQSLVSGGNSYNNQGGLVITQNAQNLTWEKAAQFDIGLDAELWNGRIGFTTDFFYQKTTNLLYNKPVYATTGFTSVAANIGALNNKGIELALNAKILTGEFKWDASANITFVKNKLLSLYDGSSQYIIPATGSNLLGGGTGIHALINGQSISAFYLLKQTGIYQQDSEVPAKLYAKGIRAGDMKYDDANRDGDITAADRQYAGKATPDYYGGFTTNLSYKGFDLSLFAQYSVGAKVYASYKGGSPEGIESLGNAFSTATLNDGSKTEQFYNVDAYAATHYWTGPGTSNFMPRAVRGGVFTGYTNGYNEEPSTHFLENGSYLRLKTLTLGYDLTPAVLKRYHINALRIFASVDNLYTFTKYDGYDPEQSYVTNPGDPNYGVDFGLQSSLRTILFGFNLKF